MMIPGTDSPSKKTNRNFAEPDKDRAKTGLFERISDFLIEALRDQLE